MSTTRNLWGELLPPDTSPPPSHILAEQAALLGQLTNNVLEGRVKVAEKWDEFGRKTRKCVEAQLRIVVPVLSNYSVSILTVRYNPLEYYPVEIIDDAPQAHNEPPQNPFMAATEEEFQDRLGAILGGERVQSIISKLRRNVEYAAQPA